MANEQTSVPLYAASEILTAANMNISAGTGVPVFATTVTRDAAFGGANEKVLAEGQLCYLSATNVVQYYDGAAWATVGPAAAAASGLVCVKAETAFTSVTSVTADNVFSSSYTNYKILFSNSGTDGSTFIAFRIGGVTTSTGYNVQQIKGEGSTAGAQRATSQTSAQINFDQTSVDGSIDITVMRPQVASITNFHATAMNATSAYTTPRNINTIGNQSASTQFDGFVITTSGTAFTGIYAVYGYSKTV
jgi:hypothetical protein